MPVDPALKDITADDINDTYKKGYIPASRKNELMRRKAESTVAELLDDKGYFNAIIERTIEHVQKGWDDFTQLDHDPEKAGVGGELKSIGQRIWGEVQVLTSVFNAVGEVTGAVAEKIALSAGASPGLAKVINVAVDVGTGLIPIGGAARSAAKGVQAIGKASKAKAGAKVADEAAKAAAKAEEQLADATMKRALNEGLKADGVQGLERFVLETDEGTKVIKEGVKALSPSEAFTKSLVKYRKEMEDITETKTHAMTLAEANKLGIGLDDLRNLVPGKALKESEMAAYLKALDEPVDDLVEWAKKTLAGEDGAGEAMSKKLMDFFEYSPKFRAAEVTAGRSVEILKETPPMKTITSLLMGWDADSLAKGDFKAAMLTVAEDIVALADQPGKLKALQVQASSAIQAHGWQRFNEVSREIYYNLLLARPVTQVRNFFGNGIATVNAVGERALGSMFSLEKKNIFDRANPMRNEGYYQINGYLAGIADGLRAYGNAFTKVTPEEASKLDFIPHKIGGVVGRIINGPSDSLRGMDGLFKSILSRGDLYAQAVRKGMQQGMKGGELSDYVARRTNMPTVEMMEQAKDFALAGTFQNDLGVLGKRIQGLTQAGPLWMLFPFMKTPMNLTKYAWNRTPGLQLLSKSLYSDIVAGGARADQAIGRLTLSNMAGMFWYGLAQQGLITGGGPADNQLRRAWLGDNKPYSIRGRDNWYNIPALEPGTTPMFLMADFAEVMNQLDDPTAEQTASAIALAGTRDIVDKSYWQTVGDVVDLIGSFRSGEEPGQQAIKIATSPALTLGTGGPLVGSVARIEDPVRREARSFVDQWRARVPGYSADMPPMRDGYGDPILIPQALGSKWLGIISPFTAADYETDEIKKEGARLQVKLPMFPWSLGGKNQDDFDVRTALPGDPLPVELSAQQRDRWQVIYRNILRHPEMGIETLLKSEQYKTAPFALQREMFMDVLAQARGNAKDALMVEDPALTKKAMSAKAGQYMPLLHPEQRPQVEQQLGESLDLIDTLLPEQQENLMKWGVMGSGEERDQEIIRGVRAEINKPIQELNEAANQGPAQPTPQQ